MADSFIQFKTNEVEFRAFLKEAFKFTSNLRIPLELISRDFYRSERLIFNLKGPGGYADLDPATKTRKNALYGFIYPILKGSGRLSESVLGPSSPESINDLSNTALRIGTSTPYGRFLQEGTKKMEARPFLFIDGGGPGFPGSAIFQGRRERWTNIVRTYIFDLYQSKGWNK